VCFDFSAHQVIIFLVDIANRLDSLTMEPDALCGGINRTGWVDIGSGIQVYKRLNGEYLIFVEDDYLSRVIMYRWSPNPLSIAITGLTLSPTQRFRSTNIIEN